MSSAAGAFRACIDRGRCERTAWRASVAEATFLNTTIMDLLVPHSVNLNSFRFLQTFANRRAEASEGSVVE